MNDAIGRARARLRKAQGEVTDFRWRDSLWRVLETDYSAALDCIEASSVTVERLKSDAGGRHLLDRVELGILVEGIVAKLAEAKRKFEEAINE